MRGARQDAGTRGGSGAQGRVTNICLREVEAMFSTCQLFALNPCCGYVGKPMCETRSPIPVCVLRCVCVCMCRYLCICVCVVSVEAQYGAKAKAKWRCDALLARKRTRRMRRMLMLNPGAMLSSMGSGSGGGRGSGSRRAAKSVPVHTCMIHVKKELQSPKYTSCPVSLPYEAEYYLSIIM